MEKTFLEKRIDDIAKEKTEKEYREFISMLLSNKFAKQLKINFNDLIIPLVNFGCNYGLLNNDCLKNSYIEHTNLKEVYENVLEENKKEETKIILNKLGAINYLFNKE